MAFYLALETLPLYVCGSRSSVSHSLVVFFFHHLAKFYTVSKEAKWYAPLDTWTLVCLLNPNFAHLGHITKVFLIIARKLALEPHHTQPDLYTFEWRKVLSQYYLHKVYHNHSNGEWHHCFSPILSTNSRRAILFQLPLSTMIRHNLSLIMPLVWKRLCRCPFISCTTLTFNTRFQMKKLFLPTSGRISFSLLLDSSTKNLHLRVHFQILIHLAHSQSWSFY